MFTYQIILLIAIFGEPILGRSNPLEWKAERDSSLQVKEFNPQNVFFFLWTRRRLADDLVWSISDKEKQYNKYKRAHIIIFREWENPTELQNITATTLLESNYSKGKQTKVIIHGWVSNGQSEWMMGMKDAFLTQGDFNVISVDWSIDASSIDYFSSAYQVVNVGQTVAAFLDALIEYGTEIEDIHVIGSSLGAHVAGSTGAHLESGILPRITGLDPALPSYTIEGIDRRLDIGDAVFVDIIHTNMGSLLEGGLAFAEPIGHIDFYPNGGHEQPGCFDNVTDILDMIYACSHRRAVSYFTESINSNLFVSKKCDSYENYVSGSCDSNTVAIMGNGVSTKASGTYYLRTNAESPFALGDDVFGQTKEERRL